MDFGTRKTHNCLSNKALSATPKEKRHARIPSGASRVVGFISMYSARNYKSA